MATKTDIINLHLANPDWTAKQLGDALNLSQVYINNCARKYDLVIPRVVAPRGQSMAALGRAAKAAGLTLQDIEAMGAST
ncbi:hypothetical protein AB8A05_04040 [Tardiphaga sp. 538_B7_N1_4]|uniref:hypothetical protein n=1 Tax=Tardiphaga sp. 538_B7_N1_4 TaxID=3240778 RepID=UPI003F1FAE91